MKGAIRSLGQFLIFLFLFLVQKVHYLNVELDQCQCKGVEQCFRKFDCQRGGNDCQPGGSVAEWLGRRS